MPKMPNVDPLRSLPRPVPRPILIDRSGKVCRVRSLQPNDVAEPHLKWMNDPVVRSGLNMSGPAMGLNDFKRYVATFDHVARNLIGVWTLEGALTGLILLEVDRRHKRGSIHVMIGDEQNRGQGLSKEGVRLVAWHCFLERRLEKLSFEPLARNEAAVAFCRKRRLRQEGHLVAHRLDERTGERLDQLIFGLTHEEFKEQLLASPVLPPFEGPGTSTAFVVEAVRGFAREAGRKKPRT
jgi:RimJ/RimL family protein N-acetyltransferase